MEESHKCHVENRKIANLTGIKEVISFDDTQVIMDTEFGLLTLKGKELHVSRLMVEIGELDVEGMVDSLIYSSNEAHRRTGKTILANLFK